MRSLKLFNAVLYNEPNNHSPLVDYDNGLIIEEGGRWAFNQIVDYYTNERLSGNDMNKTFHKSWKKVLKSSRLELAIEQIQHYMTTYGTDFQNTDGEIYIPNEVLEVPDVKLKFKVVKALTKTEMIEKCMGLLKSGIALKEETIDDVLSLMVDELDYQFTGKENIRNKEAIVKIAEHYNVYPNDPVEFLRFIVYRATGETLLIKNQYMKDLIIRSNFNPSQMMKQYGLERLATIFNRFKPLFLSFKGKCPRTINTISRLSKTHHKPMTDNPLNQVTEKLLTDNDTHWLDNATPFALFKALNACYTRLRGQEIFTYRIRNGKSWSTDQFTAHIDVCSENYDFILTYMTRRFEYLKGKKVFIPEDVEYALPTSEKMFVGNIPTGTKFYGNKLAVGIYWENDWGARDLDLSANNIGGKIGWNSDYYNGNGSLVYSGDITNAPDGAVEYMYARNGFDQPSLIMNNVFRGNDDCEYKIIIGRGDKVKRNYMMNPNNLFAEIKTQSVQKQTILGMVLPDTKEDKQCFVVLNVGSGNARVSGYSQNAMLSLNGLYQQWTKSMMLNNLLTELGSVFVDKQHECDVDLSIDSLEKDTFTNLFKQREFL